MGDVLGSQHPTSVQFLGHTSMVASTSVHFPGRPSMIILTKGRRIRDGVPVVGRMHRQDAFRAKQLAQQKGAAPGATYVTSSSSQPYNCPGVPRLVHALSSSLGPGLLAISVPDTSQASLTTICDLKSSMCTQTEAMAAIQLQMDTMLRTIQPPQLLTMSVPAPPVSADKFAQIIGFSTRHHLLDLLIRPSFSSGLLIGSG